MTNICVMLYVLVRMPVSSLTSRTAASEISSANSESPPGNFHKGGYKNENICNSIISMYVHVYLYKTHPNKRELQSTHIYTPSTFHFKNKKSILD